MKAELCVDTYIKDKSEMLSAVDMRSTRCASEIIDGFVLGICFIYVV